MIAFVHKLKTQLPGVQVLCLPSKFSKLSNAEYSRLIDVDREHVRELVEEDIGFEEIEESIEKGFV